MTKIDDALKDLTEQVDKLGDVEYHLVCKINSKKHEFRFKSVLPIQPSAFKKTLMGNASVASNHTNAPKTLVEQGYVSNTGQVKKEDAAPVTAKLDPNSKVTVNAVIKVEGPGTVTSVSATGEGNAEPGSVGVQEAE